MSWAGMNNTLTPESDQTLVCHRAALHGARGWSFTELHGCKPGTGTASSIPHLLRGEARALPTDLHRERHYTSQLHRIPEEGQWGFHCGDFWLVLLKK